MHGSLSRLWLAVLLAAITGCWNSGPQRIDVQGTVTYKGHPVPKGVIFFDPDASKGHDGPQGHAIITNGHIDTRDTGNRGVVPGPHLVRIHGFDGVPGQELPMGKLLFPEYSKKVELTGDLATCDVVVPSPESAPSQ